MGEPSAEKGPPAPQVGDVLGPVRGESLADEPLGPGTVGQFYAAQAERCRDPGQEVAHLIQGQGPNLYLDGRPPSAWRIRSGRWCGPPGRAKKR